MFIHCVLFRIKRTDIPVYKRDCVIWKKEARQYPGFIGYHTLRRVDKKGQYASFYMWKKAAHHKRFMKAHHDRLVSLSHCPVQVLGYYNFQTV